MGEKTKKILGSLLSILVIVGFSYYYKYSNGKINKFIDGYNRFSESIRVMYDYANKNDDKLRKSDVQEIAQSAKAMVEDKRGCQSIPDKTLREECGEVYLSWQVSAENYLRHESDFMFMMEVAGFIERYGQFREDVMNKYKLKEK